MTVSDPGPLLMLADPSLLRSTCLVGGKWIAAADGATIDVTNPATGILIGSVPALGPVEIGLAIEAAREAQGPWSAMTAKARAAILRGLYELLMANVDDLARIMTAEQGKPLAEAKGEVAYAASFIEWFGEEAKRVYGDIIPSPWGDHQLLVQKQPIGVFAAITPWNFPLAMITRKAGPGWAAGCTGVLRPANETPLTALAFGVLAERAGLPPGVCNIVTGDPVETGRLLCESPAIRKLSFTGSTRVGALLLAQCAPTIKKTSMELGGNAPFIVFDDADVEAAVQGAMISKYRNTGQTCVCANRFLVQSGIYDRFAARFAEQVATLVPGNGMDPEATQGPLIHGAAVTKVEHHIADAVERGATILTGGKPHASGGNFFEPTVLSHVSTQSLILREETFGPVAPLVRFDHEEDAVRLANDTPFGLAAYFYSRDIGRVFRVASALEAGMIGINAGIISTEVAPFGGVKASGLGREGSRYRIEDYLETKYLCLGGLG